MEKLISMTDFVLEQRMTSEQISESSFFDIQTHISNYYDNVFAYANFLEQPLTLGMFVPCDEEGNVIEFGKYSFPTNEEMKQFKEAKEKVLFNTKYKIGICYNEKAIHFDGKCTQIISNFSFLTIEDIAHWNFELTESAIKQIFGDT